MTGQYVEERERERVKERLRGEGRRDLRKESEGGLYGDIRNVSAIVRRVVLVVDHQWPTDGGCGSEGGGSGGCDGGVVVMVVTVVMVVRVVVMVKVVVVVVVRVVVLMW